MNGFSDNEEYYYKKYLKYKNKYLLKKQTGRGILDSVKNKVKETGKNIKDKIFKSLYEKISKKFSELTLEDFILFVTTLIEVYDKLIKNDKIKDISNINISSHKTAILDIINENSSNNEVRDLITKLKEMVDSNDFDHKKVDDNILYKKLLDYTLNTILEDHKEIVQLLEKQKDILVLGVLSVLVRTLTETVLEGDFDLIKKILLQIVFGLISSSKNTISTPETTPVVVTSQNTSNITSSHMSGIEKIVEEQIATEVEKVVKEQVEAKVKELVEKHFANNEVMPKSTQ